MSMLDVKQYEFRTSLAGCWNNAGTVYLAQNRKNSKFFCIKRFPLCDDIKCIKVHRPASSYYLAINFPIIPGGGAHDAAIQTPKYPASPFILCIPPGRLRGHVRHVLRLLQGHAEQLLQVGLSRGDRRTYPA